MKLLIPPIMVEEVLPVKQGLKHNCVCVHKNLLSIVEEVLPVKQG